MTSGSDGIFLGPVADLYERYLVPLIFEPYAGELVQRLTGRPVGRVLEIAAGTGVVTRRLAGALDSRVDIVATDLNQAMLDQASAIRAARPIEWRQADALDLPFGDQEFDAVLCQFGVMFFSPKAAAFAEAHRVLRPGGCLLFNVWDRIEENQFADTVTTALERVFPHDPPRFLARTPHGYHDIDQIRRDLVDGGFDREPAVVTLSARSRADSAEVPAIGYCQGTPLRNEIVARDASRLGQATEAATEALRKQFGCGAVDGKIQAHVFSLDKAG